MERKKEREESLGTIDTSSDSLAATDTDDDSDAQPIPPIHLHPASSASNVRRRSSIKVSISDGFQKSIAEAASRAASSRPLYRPLEISETTNSEDENTHLEEEQGPLSTGKGGREKLYHLLLPYYRVMKEYPMYRAYFFSHFCQNMGDWFVRIASLLVVEALNNSQNETENEDSDGSDGRMLSHLVLSVLLPRAIFSQVGGVISDRYDRRKLMIGLDLAGGVVVLGYLLGLYYESLPWIYVVSMMRSSLAATYYPVTTGMVALLIPSPSDLQYAVTLNSWAWGSTSILGGLLAGSLAGRIGLSTCYWIDSVTFFLSAWVVAYGIQGNFRVSTSPHTSVEGDKEDPARCNLPEAEQGIPETEIMAKPSVITVVIQNFIGLSHILS